MMTKIGYIFILIFGLASFLAKPVIAKDNSDYKIFLPVVASKSVTHTFCDWNKEHCKTFQFTGNTATLTKEDLYSYDWTWQYIDGKPCTHAYYSNNILFKDVVADFWLTAEGMTWGYVIAK
jgi:hypothetical protein